MVVRYLKHTCYCYKVRRATDDGACRCGRSVGIDEGVLTGMGSVHYDLRCNMCRGTCRAVGRICSCFKRILNQ